MDRPSAITLKKINKKILRGLQLINKDFKLKLTLNDNFDKKYLQGKNIVIINGGLTTGLDEISVTQLFISYGYTGVKEVLMVPGKQYCFVQFNNELEASEAAETMCGKAMLPGTCNPLYIVCITEVPDIKRSIVYQMPPGLTVYEEFISSEEENVLANLISWIDMPNESAEGSNLKHRQVRHFGYEFKYGSNSVDRESPLEQKIPVDLIPICQRIVDMKLMSDFPDQLTINRYEPGQGIPPHVDTHQSFTGEILSLSILGGITMDYYCHSGSEQEEGIPINNSTSNTMHYAVYLPPRSLCVMSGPSRYQWTHGICPRKTDVYPDKETRKLSLLPRTERISFTFRKVRADSHCSCSYPTLCDAQSFRKEKCGNNVHEPLKNEAAAELEIEHVLKVYEEIADHFSETRHKPWPKVLEFVELLPIASLVLDVGCGNGKYLGHNRNIYQIGSDTSSKLLEICVDRGYEVSLSNCLTLPFRNDGFDAVICIAVIHHLASEERRLQAVKEILRVLRVGGHALIYVWALEQNRDRMSAYLKQKRSNRVKAGFKKSNVQHETSFSSSHIQFNDKYYGKACEINCNGPGSTDDSSKQGELSTAQNDVSQCKVVYSAKNKNDCRGQLTENIGVKNAVTNHLSVHENRTEFKEQDMFVPWKIKPHKFQPKSCKNTENGLSDAIPTYHRFYHVFKEGELERLIKICDNGTTLKSYYDEGNWCIVVEKVEKKPIKS